ncbi:MAG TPA: hypothetical protein VKZ94_13145 [Advenella sp.]|nr:hypothetical protein [Advenella sp.]
MNFPFVSINVPRRFPTPVKRAMRDFPNLRRRLRDDARMNRETVLGQPS